MTFKGTVRKLDQSLAGGGFRDWYLRNFILGGRWGEFMDVVGLVAPDSMVLDLGAGEADLKERLSKARYVALDRGIGHGGWDYSKLDVVGDAMAIPFAGASFDAIVCKQVLEHIPEPVKMLSDARRVLKPGGVILLSTNQAWPQHQQPYDFFRFTSFGLRYCFETAGFEVERMEAMGGAFTAAMFHVSQTLAPHLWSRSMQGRKVARLILKPFEWLMRLLVPLVTALDKLDRTKDNTLGWYVLARAPK